VKNAFYDGTFERKCIPEFKALKKIDQEGPNLSEQFNKLIFNWEFIAKCFE
jgi:hypothetical protein